MDQGKNIRDFINEVVGKYYGFKYVKDLYNNYKYRELSDGIYFSTDIPVNFNKINERKVWEMILTRIEHDGYPDLINEVKSIFNFRKSHLQLLRYDLFISKVQQQKIVSYCSFEMQGDQHFDSSICFGYLNGDSNTYADSVVSDEIKSSVGTILIPMRSGFEGKMDAFKFYPIIENALKSKHII